MARPTRSPCPSSSTTIPSASRTVEKRCETSTPSCPCARGPRAASMRPNGSVSVGASSGGGLVERHQQRRLAHQTARQRRASCHCPPESSRRRRSGCRSRCPGELEVDQAEHRLVGSWIGKHQALQTDPAGAAAPAPPPGPARPLQLGGMILEPQQLSRSRDRRVEAAGGVRRARDLGLPRRSAYSARASAIRCRCPPDRSTPPL